MSGTVETQEAIIEIEGFRKTINVTKKDMERRYIYLFIRSHFLSAEGKGVNNDVLGRKVMFTHRGTYIGDKPLFVADLGHGK